MSTKLLITIYSHRSSETFRVNIFPSHPMFHKTTNEKRKPSKDTNTTEIQKSIFVKNNTQDVDTAAHKRAHTATSNRHTAEAECRLKWQKEKLEIFLQLRTIPCVSAKKITAKEFCVRFSVFFFGRQKSSPSSSSSSVTYGELVEPTRAK